MSDLLILKYLPRHYHAGKEYEELSFLFRPFGYVCLKQASMRRSLE